MHLNTQLIIILSTQMMKPCSLPSSHSLELCCYFRDETILSLETTRQFENTTRAYLVLWKQDSSTQHTTILLTPFHVNRVIFFILGSSKLIQSYLFLAKINFPEYFILTSTLLLFSPTILYIILKLHVEKKCLY